MSGKNIRSVLEKKGIAQTVNDYRDDLWKD